MLQRPQNFVRFINQHYRSFTTVPCYQVDSFSDRPFAGNPAAVCLLTVKEGTTWPMSDEQLLLIAAENNLSETAFIIPAKTTNRDNKYLSTIMTSNTVANSPFATDSHFHLRWFTPTTEVDLCGHATLATAAVLLQKCGNTNPSLHFETKSGVLVASVSTESNKIEMELPLNPPDLVASPHFEDLPLPIAELVDVVLGIEKEEEKVNASRHGQGTVIVDSVSYNKRTKKLVVTLSTALGRDYLEKLSPSSGQLLDIDQSSLYNNNIKGLIVTMKSEDNEYDFISRYFAPWVGIDEDPVTGSAHTVIAPLWSMRMAKNELYARQCSPRGGDVGLRIENDVLHISGEACVVLEGDMRVD
jgi:PhzF family phenazine biosynthesis protein